MLAYLQGWILLQAMMVIACWRFLGGWIGAFFYLAGALIYTVWDNV